MVKAVKALAVAVAVAAACGCHGSGTHYTLMVTASSTTMEEVTEISVNLLRTGTTDALNFDFTPPMPTPDPPWVFDLQTREWGDSPIECEVFALDSFGLLANGTGGPDEGVIHVQLQDTGLSGPIDLAEPPPFPFDFGFGSPPDAGAPPPFFDAAPGI